MASENCNEDPVSEEKAIEAGLAIANMDVSQMEDSDFKRGMQLFQKLAFAKRK